jgi:hypothetical protein
MIDDCQKAMLNNTISQRSIFRAAAHTSRKAESEVIVERTLDVPAAAFYIGGQAPTSAKGTVKMRRVPLGRNRFRLVCAGLATTEATRQSVGAKPSGQNAPRCPTPRKATLTPKQSADLGAQIARLQRHNETMREELDRRHRAAFALQGTGLARIAGINAAN